MQKGLLHFFTSWIRLEEQAEVVKEVICDRVGLNVYRIFQRIDMGNKGFFDGNDVRTVIGNIGFRDFDIEKLIKMWGFGGKKVSYKDFLSWVLPYNKFPKAISESTEVSYDINYSLNRLFEKEIETIIFFEEACAELSLSLHKKIGKAFELLSEGNKPGITQEALYNFLSVNNIRITESTAYAVIRRLDKDNDGIISLADFLESINQPLPYRNLQKNRSSPKISSKTQLFLQESKKSLSSRNSLNSFNAAEQTLVNLFNGLISLEKALEESRNRLALRLDFNSRTLFEVFDRKKNKVVSELDFERALKEFGIKTSANNVFLIFSHYDSNMDGMLSFHDFEEIFISKKSNFACLVFEREKTREFSLETRQMILETLVLIIEIEQNAEHLRQKVSSSQIALQDFFSYIDRSKVGYLTVNEFRRVLMENSIFPTSRDLSALLSRFDPSHSGRVSFTNFIEQLLPKSPLLA